MEKTALNVPDMSCEGCVNAVKRALEGVEGVDGAEVSLEDKRATVTHGPEVRTSELVAAVETAGYKATEA